MTADPVTIDYYQREAPVYTAGGDQGQSRHLEEFLSHLQTGARILELGCGGGRDSAFIAERGFDLDATDGTPAMTQKAHERTGLPIRVMQFDELSADQAYDAVWAHACLLHVKRQDLPAILSRIHRALRPAGWHFANFKLGDGEARDQFGRLFNFPTAEWLESTYRAAGFTIADTATYDGSGTDKVPRKWLALTVRKA